MAGRGRSNENELLVALGHPLRRQILREMGERGAASPRELATLLERPLSNVSYHVRVLADCAAVNLVRTEPVRGSVQHFYRLAVEAPWALQVIGLDGGAGQGESSDGTAT